MRIVYNIRYLCLRWPTHSSSSSSSWKWQYSSSSTCPHLADGKPWLSNFSTPIPKSKPSSKPKLVSASSLPFSSWTVKVNKVATLHKNSRFAIKTATPLVQLHLHRDQIQLFEFPDSESAEKQVHYCHGDLCLLSSQLLHLGPQQIVHKKITARAKQPSIESQQTRIKRNCQRMNDSLYDVECIQISLSLNIFVQSVNSAWVA